MLGNLPYTALYGVEPFTASSVLPPKVASASMLWNGISRPSSFR